MVLLCTRSEAVRTDMVIAVSARIQGERLWRNIFIIFRFEVLCNSLGILRKYALFRVIDISRTIWDV